MYLTYVTRLFSFSVAVYLMQGKMCAKWFIRRNMAVWVTLLLPNCQLISYLLYSSNLRWAERYVMRASVYAFSACMRSASDSMSSVIVPTPA